ncbi:vacuolar protein-sorting-associated protein 25 [Alligator sinensis]|uniref:Vacuolar protein-sorting-associated protein 25 n=1 Tax=Alligator sinensis TaxID=38654 RepID=A0A1U7RC12_ALLSI|nr:vacuolar protein-sorting-associated protein 25 [Alligator sinensis]
MRKARAVGNTTQQPAPGPGARRSSLGARDSTPAQGERTARGGTGAARNLGARGGPEVRGPEAWRGGSVGGGGGGDEHRGRGAWPCGPLLPLPAGPAPVLTGAPGASSPRLQPNVDTRQKQLAAWCSLVLSYCRLSKQCSMTVMEAQDSPLFHNRKLQRKLPMESIQVVLEELRKKGNLEWLDKNKSSFLVMWRRPEEWGKLIYQWVVKNGLTNSVFTLYELVNGDDTENEEFHGLDESILLRALQALQQEHKTEIITLDDGRGVKFF